jgi:uncharacterized protein (TIGR00730 family)
MGKSKGKAAPVTAPSPSKDKQLQQQLKKELEPEKPYDQEVDQLADQSVDPPVVVLSVDQPVKEEMEADLSGARGGEANKPKENDFEKDPVMTHQSVVDKDKSVDGNVAVCPDNDRAFEQVKEVKADGAVEGVVSASNVSVADLNASDRKLKVCVYGSSSSRTSKAFTDAAYELGLELAKRGHICVNGGGANGVMGALNEGCVAGKGEIIGVIHQMFIVDGQEDSRITNMVVCRGNDLKERKQQLLDNGDAIIVMPGGVGTLDELWDAVCTKSLGLGGLLNKPISVVNVNNYFDGSIAQLKAAEMAGLLYGPANTYFEVHSSAAEALDWCAAQIQAVKDGKPVSSNLATIREASASPCTKEALTPKADALSSKLATLNTQRIVTEKHPVAVIRPPHVGEETKQAVPIRIDDKGDKNIGLPAMMFGMAVGVCLGLALSRLRR